MRHRLPGMAISGGLVALVLGGAPLPGQARSSFALPFPPEGGRVPAVTFDTDGRAVGHSEFVFEATAGGHYQLRVDMEIAGGARNHTSAELVRIAPNGDGEATLRLLTEQSQSFAADGTPMTLLRVDHEAGLATCTPPERSHDRPAALPLPADDRVANVPLNLLFLPLVRGEAERIRFQIFVCRGGAKLHRFVAFAHESGADGDERIVEVRYGPDLGSLMSWMASRVMPRLSFWFDTGRNGAYVAHRMPIYSRGPEIVMIRDGVTPPELGEPF